MKAFLDSNVLQYNHPDFIPADPISVPHRYSRKEDIEISGFLAATIAWGNRVSILNSANRLMDLMEDAPFEFISSARAKDYKRFEGFVHRTFNGTDCIYFLRALKEIYRHHGGLEGIFSGAGAMDEKIHRARHIFLSFKAPARTGKHFSDPLAGSAAKRINMYLRWMVRRDLQKVDFGIWKSVSPAELCCPLDVHSGRVARMLGLLERKQNDWKAVMELTENLRKLDPKDPVKYDFALFGMGTDGMATGIQIR
jgi:uncharacterized protein (TIGR02757 family)